ncbi:hypothetical protein LTR53_012731 [Teratosphaeriaceae sp. CCFEE 6253]|nr:hypothetical protein LTR53_012731 [Teratosphaeriaceae sp. CCFEE 6253]
MKVLIVGAGVAGLALGQMLRKQGIALEIFERDEGTRKQGWALGLDECLADLKRCLPADIDPLSNASTNYAAQKADTYAIVHGGTHEVLGLMAPQDGGLDFMSADRNSLRQILSKHLNVQYGKRLKSFVQGEDGVTVHFADGTTAHGTVLVGADGANSTARAHLLPEFNASSSRYAMLSANVTLAKEEYQPMLDRANTCVIVGWPDTKSYIMIMAYNDDGTATWHWAVAKRYEDRATANAWGQTASAEELYQEALRQTDDFPEYFRAAVKLTGAEGMHLPPIKLIETVLPVDVLPDGTVTLLGDAAHSMVKGARRHAGKDLS